MPGFTLKDGLGKYIDLLSTRVKILSLKSIDNNEQSQAMLLNKPTYFKCTFV